MQKFILLFLALIFGGEICRAQAPVAADTASLDYKQFGLLAIQDGGRRKPIDTFARETLIRVTGRSTYTDKAGRKWTPNDFVLSALLETHDWRNEPMVLVSLGQVIEKLGLDKTQRRFTFAQLTALPELNRLANEAHALRKAEKPLDRLQQEIMSVSERLALFTNVINGNAFLIVPAPKSETDPWVLPPEYSQYYSDEQFAPIQIQLQTVATSYTSGDGFNFSRASNQLRDSLRNLSPRIYPQDRQLRLEYFYNHFEGFFWATCCYGLAFIMLLIVYAQSRGMRYAAIAMGVAAAIMGFATQGFSHPWWIAGAAIWILVGIIGARLPTAGRVLPVFAVILVLGGLVFHATGIVLRCLIAGRPPVTNMYESIIWVSFAVSFFGMIFFARYRTSVYLLAALPVTLIALLLVHQMPIAMPSSIDPLVPVLRDNFWLTIHVLTITLSYAAFALAMGFGHILLFRYARDPQGARADAPMHFWLYRVLQLGVLLLAAGTILGGVWANYSWGRFWGWDPKETWALIALLCYIVTLHGRLAGWWTQFGLVVASVVCFLAVLMAWYGVNFVLGKGLHSYGFGIGGETYVATFVIVDLAFVAFAIWRYRKSRRVGDQSRQVEAERITV